MLFSDAVSPRAWGAKIDYDTKTTAPMAYTANTDPASTQKATANGTSRRISSPYRHDLTSA